MSKNVVVYHNPRCSKSRQAVALLEARGLSLEIVLYLKEPPSVSELVGLAEKLSKTPREMMRKKEAVYQELALDDVSLTEEQLFEAIHEHPILLERPVVIQGERALIARPPERLEEWLAP